MRATTSWYRMAMQIGMGFGKFLARVLFQELGISVPSSVFHVLFITLLARVSRLKLKRFPLRQALGNMRAWTVCNQIVYTPANGYEFF